MKPGIYPGIRREDYDAIEAVNQSLLCEYRRTPAHARHRMLNGKAATEPMRLGTLLHCYLLERERFDQTHVELPDLTAGIRTKDGREPANPRATAEYKAKLAEFGQQNIGKVFVQPEDLAVCRAVAESVAASQTATELLTAPGDNEVAVVWADPETGLLCKGLLDRLADWNGHRVVVDLKTSESAGASAFARNAADYAMHWQSTFYGWGLKMNRRPASRFLHIVCETVPPYGVAVYELTPASLDQGWREVRGALTTHAACLSAGYWPGYPDRIEEVALPRWAMNETV